MARARRQLGVAIVALVCFAMSVTGAAAADASGVVELMLPRPPAAQEAVWLQVQPPPLARGTRLRVLTGDGVLLGAVVPFGTRPDQDSGTYTIPLPATAIVDGRVRLRLEIEEAGSPPRPLRPGEASVDLIYLPVTR